MRFTLEMVLKRINDINEINDLITEREMNKIRSIIHSIKLKGI